MHINIYCIKWRNILVNVQLHKYIDVLWADVNEAAVFLAKYFRCYWTMMHRWFVQRLHFSQGCLQRPRIPTMIRINHFFLNTDRWKFTTNHFYALTQITRLAPTHAHSFARAIAHALGQTVPVTELPLWEGDTWWHLTLANRGVDDDVNLNAVLSVIETPLRSLNTTFWGWHGVNLNSMIEERSVKGSHSKQCFQYVQS